MGTDDHISAPSQDAIESARALYHSIRGVLPEAVTDFKLATNADHNSYGVFLYNTMEKDAEYRGSPDEPLVSDEVLRRHGSQIVELNYQRHKIYQERVGLWKEYCDLNHLRLSFATCCEASDDYDDLVEMGPSIIAPLMVEYPSDTAGYWYEVLHKIIHGRNMGAYMVQKGALYDAWYRFFNGGGRL
ncbi:hypothetical protein MGU_08509 [Metarhizium guizhouense ARSEF 977]|uniref:Uncharacterized protein n=1 Tax=Metarhizium guizhouense (strain ARSEF 977) TaxID=1276136 RepID=A0A0B4GX66_METGA|nr:hypothetical protein MGU_08509 [Metarhizium guizhouense ARSEF 977]